MQTPTYSTYNWRQHNASIFSFMHTLLLPHVRGCGHVFYAIIFHDNACTHSHCPPRGDPRRCRYGDGTAEAPDPNVTPQAYQAPMTAESGNVYCMAPNDLHSVANTDAVPFHSVRLELKGYNTTDPASFGYLGCPNEICSEARVGQSGQRAAVTADSHDTPLRQTCTSFALKVGDPALNKTAFRLVLENTAVRVWDLRVNAGEATTFVIQSPVSVVVVDKKAGFIWSSGGVAVAASATFSVGKVEYYAAANL